MKTKYQLALVLLALVGAGIVLIATSPYGAGLTPDSVGYIAVARNLIQGTGFITYEGDPVVVWPPLYPILLALGGGIFGTDPLNIAHFMNALFFSLIVYVGGFLAHKHLSSFPVFFLAGTSAVVFSIPLFHVSVMAWSESLFILLILLSLVFAHSYIVKNDLASLILFSLSVALSSLTRYIGIILIIWGALIILIFCRDRLKYRIAHLSLFTLISTIPLGLWLIRNYAISSTIWGPRASAASKLSQNIARVFHHLLSWYFPGRIAERQALLIIICLGVGLFVYISLKDSRGRMKEGRRQIGTLILFVFMYTAFLVISSTSTAYDQIDNRLLSPIYVPLTLLLFIFALAVAELYQKRFSQKIMNSFLIVGTAIWLVYPISSTILNAAHVMDIGQGYSGKSWTKSETVQYLLQHRTIASEGSLYTNGPDAAYILARLIAKTSPAKTSYNSSETADDISSLKGSWPEEDRACLIWFDKIERTYLYAIDELHAIANMDLMVRLEDGAIYAVTKKEDV